MPDIMTVANYKGDVGKTTLAALLAVTLSERFGKKVLVIDGDPQTNLTEVFVNEVLQSKLIQHADMFNRLFSLDYIARAGTGEEPFIVSLTQNLALIPSKPSYLRKIAAFNIAVDTVREAKRYIVTRFKDFDFIFIDLPPQLYTLVSPLMSLADYIIIPVSKTFFALYSLQYLLENDKTGQQSVKFLGAVLVRFRTVEVRAISWFRRLVNEAVAESYSVLGLKWELDGKGVEPVFRSVLYYHPPLANIRALPFDALGNSYILRLVRGEIKRGERVVKNAEEIAKELLERISLSK
jgi:cellulose biosynthesis protein BcsQ